MKRSTEERRYLASDDQYKRSQLIPVHAALLQKIYRNSARMLYECTTGAHEGF